MIGYLYDDNIDDILLDQLLSTAHQAGVSFCAIRLDAMKQMLGGSKSEVLFAADGTYTKGTAALPAIVDCTFPADSKLTGAKYGTDFLALLQEKTHVCIQKSVPKSRFPAFLYCFGLFEYAIPTYVIQNYSDFQKAAAMFPDAILKPSGGRMGAKVYLLHKAEDGMIIEKDGTSELLTEDTVNAYLADIKEAKMGVGLLQPYMDFHTPDGCALEFKLLKHRDETGDWQDVGTYAMVGSSSVVANISKGGIYADAYACVQAIAGKNADSLYHKIMDLGIAVAKGIERLYGLNAYCLGIDIAVELKTMQPYVIEANTYPNTKRFTPAIAEKRLSYYNYLLKHLGEKR